MNPKKKGRRGCLIVFISIFALLLVAFVLYFVFGPGFLTQRRAEFSPPNILVIAPMVGDTVPSNNSMLVQATVTGRNPISRVEVWLDGQLADSQTFDSSFRTVLYPEFDLQIPEGTHMLALRAVDNAGLVGQSMPIHIAGQLAEGLGETKTVPAKQGQSLAQIAQLQGVDLGTIHDLNPELGEGGLPANTPVVVPVLIQRGGGLAVAANAPTPPLPKPPSDTQALLPVKLPIVDLDPLFAAFMQNLPSAPSHIQVGFENCTIRIVWNDNADNEQNFRVWMQALGGPPLNIKTLQARPGTGQTWFEFASPSFGIYSFWVESVNALGGQSSEIQWVAVNDTECGEGVVSQLEIEALGMSGIGAGWDRIYCYLSIEGFPEKRIPQDDSQFLQMDFLGGTDIHKWVGGAHRLLIKIPMDNELTLEGDCWGWLGALPSSMGTFSVNVPSEQWDNRTLQISSAGYVIDYRVRLFGPSQADGAFAYTDYSIPPPYDVSITNAADQNSILIPERGLSTVIWKWNGNPADISGFTVYVNDHVAAWQPIDPVVLQNLLAGNSFQTILDFPFSCETTYTIQVAANSENAQSVLSAPTEYRQSPCGYQQSSIPFHYLYSSQYDCNEIWIVRYDSAGNKIVDLVSKDLTNWVSRKREYQQSGVINPRRLHGPADEPNVAPYYYFEYIQERVEFGGEPIYYDKPVSSTSFAVGVNHLGSVWELLRETMLLFDPTGYPTSRFEQIYRGPDGQLYIYEPGRRDLKLLEDAINEGNGIYKLSDFD